MPWSPCASSMSSRERSARRRSRRAASRRRAKVPDTAGFTLFEVLAAIFILGLWYVVLAQVALRSVMAESDTERRLEASLIADRVLDDLEAELDLGPVQVGERREEQEDFAIVTRVAPFDATALLPAAEPGAPRPSAAPSLLRATAGAAEPPLVVVEVEVLWGEGDLARSVRRTSYARNVDATSALIESLPSAGAGDGERQAPGEGEEPA